MALGHGERIRVQEACNILPVPLGSSSGSLFFLFHLPAERSSILIALIITLFFGTMVFTLSFLGEQLSVRHLGKSEVKMFNRLPSLMLKLFAIHWFKVNYSNSAQVSR